MKKTTILILFWSLWIFTLIAGGNQDRTFVPSDDVYNWSPSKGLDHSLLGRGVNLGNYLEAPRDGKITGEGNWNGGRSIEEEDLKRISQAGFAHVRLPIRWTDYCQEEPPYLINARSGQGYSMLDRVKEILVWARKENLKVILDIHHYQEMMSAPQSDQSYHEERLLALWDQLCQEFPLEEYPRDFLYFELLNEPNGSVSEEDWNRILANLTELIWSTNQELQRSAQGDRYIVIGTANWGGVPALAKLELPQSCHPDNTIVTLHFYEPFHFTHQGAEWAEGSEEWIGRSWKGSPQQRAHMDDFLDSIVEWNQEGYPIYIGEYGVYTKYADPDDQARWTDYIARGSEARGFSWAYWEYSAGHGFWDPWNQEWREKLFQSLIPPQ